MIDAERDPTTTYHVVPEPSGLYYITVYPRNPKPLAHRRYRVDVLPEWMLEGIRLMDIAGSGVRIESMNMLKIGDRYWFEAV